MAIIKECNKVVNELIAKEFRMEAKEIIRLTTDLYREEFLLYHEQVKENICCLVLDKAKRQLIAEGKLKSKEEDAFGKPFML